MNDIDSIRVSLFKDGKEDFLALLSAEGIQYELRRPPIGMIVAAAEWIELLKALSLPAVVGGLATVIVAYLRHKHGRKVIITTKDNVVVHAEGLTKDELQQVLKRASNITVVEKRADPLKLDTPGHG
jgi:hypothetical protein